MGVTSSVGGRLDGVAVSVGKADLVGGRVEVRMRDGTGVGISCEILMQDVSRATSKSSEIVLCFIFINCTLQ
jgi:hypothetical protein